MQANAGWGHCGALQVGSILFTVVILTVHLEVACVLDHWTVMHHISIWFSICALPCQSHHWGCLSTCMAAAGVTLTTFGLI